MIDQAKLDEFLELCETHLGSQCREDSLEWLKIEVLPDAGGRTGWNLVEAGEFELLTEICLENYSVPHGPCR